MLLADSEILNLHKRLIYQALPQCEVFDCTSQDAPIGTVLLSLSVAFIFILRHFRLQDIRKGTWIYNILFGKTISRMSCVLQLLSTEWL